MKELKKVLKYYFWYIRDKDNRPIITVCLAHDEEANIFSRGIAVCIWKDNPDKKLGRKIAKDRAIKAMGTRCDDVADTMRYDRLIYKITCTNNLSKYLPVLGIKTKDDTLVFFSQFKVDTFDGIEIFTMQKESKKSPEETEALIREAIKTGRIGLTEKSEKDG